MAINIKRVILQFIKFNIIGIVNFAITYPLFCLLVYFKIHYIIAMSIEYAVGITLSFILNKIITFQNEEKINLSMITKMIGSYLLSFFLNATLSTFLIEVMSINKYFSRLIAIGAAVCLAFPLQKYFVFAKKPGQREGDKAE